MLLSLINEQTLNTLQRQSQLMFNFFEWRRIGFKYINIYKTKENPPMMPHISSKEPSLGVLIH